MTKKHYQAIAERLRQARHRAASTTHAVDVIDRLAEDLAEEFIKTNAAFNRELFLRASGVGAPPDPPPRRDWMKTPPRAE